MLLAIYLAIWADIAIYYNIAYIRLFYYLTTVFI